MTVSSQTSTATFVGNGVATAFPLPFRFFNNSDIRAYFIDSVTGAATQMVLGSDYTLIGAGEPEVDGNALSLLTTTVPLASMRGLYVERVMPQVQGTDIVNQGQFFASTHEDVFDRLTMLIQQANANSAGAIRVAIGDPEPARLVPAAVRANLLLGFDDQGNPIAVAPASGSASDLAIRLANNADPAKGAALVGYKGRTVAGRLSDVPSVKDFGAVGDGSTNDSVAVSNCIAAGKRSFSPAGTYLTTIPASSMISPFWGDGQIKDASGNKRGPWFSQLTSAPAAAGNESSVTTAFNGDWSKSQIAIEHRITGANTLGKPVSGYKYTPEAMPSYIYLYNESGWNQSTTGNGGRTGVAAHRVKVDQYGQGDAVAYNASAFVTGSKPGQTNFLAAPAAVLFNGDMQAGNSGTYMNPYETICSDGGFDVACIGIVNNFDRTNAAGALSTVWNGYRAQSVGSASCDAIVSAVGKWKTGLDFAMSGLDFGTNQAAISLKGGQRIYLNNAAVASGPLDTDWRSTVFNGDYISYSGGKIVLAAGGNPTLQVSSSQVTVTQDFKHAGVVFGVFNATPVGKLNGWGTPTGNSVIANFSGSSATLAQTSAAVAQIINYMKQLGFFGA